MHVTLGSRVLISERASSAVLEKIHRSLRFGSLLALAGEGRGTPSNLRGKSEWLTRTSPWNRRMATLPTLWGQGTARAEVADRKRTAAIRVFMVRMLLRTTRDKGHPFRLRSLEPHGREGQAASTTECLRCLQLSRPCRARRAS